MQGSFSIITRASALLLALTLALCACAEAGSGTVLTRTDFLLDTFVTVTLYGTDNSGALDGAFELCRDYDAMLDRHSEQSEIYRLNHAEGRPVSVSPQLRELLEISLEYCELSGGKFDITIAPVADLWDFKAEAPTLPDPAEISRALGLVDWRSVGIDGDAVTLGNGAQIDLGAIAKGYIADRLAEYLKEQGIESALIDLGGNLVAVGGKPGGKPFEIGVQKPFEAGGKIAGVVEVKDVSLVTSGVYERYFIYDGVTYHHILDTSDGYPADSGLASVTIISEKSVDGDALSTVCFLLGEREGMALIECTEGAEAVFIDSRGEITLSSGALERYRFKASNG